MKHLVALFAALFIFAALVHAAGFEMNTGVGFGHGTAHMIVHVSAPTVHCTECNHGMEFNVVFRGHGHMKIPPELVLQNVAAQVYHHHFEFRDHNVIVMEENNGYVYVFHVKKHVKFLGIIPLDVTGDLYCNVSELSAPMSCSVHMSPLMQLLYLLSVGVSTSNQ